MKKFVLAGFLVLLTSSLQAAWIRMKSSATLISSLLIFSMSENIQKLNLPPTKEEAGAGEGVVFGFLLVIADLGRFVGRPSM